MVKKDPLRCRFVKNFIDDASFLGKYMWNRESNQVIRGDMSLDSFNKRFGKIMREEEEEENNRWK